MDRFGWNLGGHIPPCPTCPPWCGCHGNGRCLATTHWILSSYGRLEAERVNQFWWNLVHNSKFGTLWQSRDQILNFLKFKMADSRHAGKYSKCHNSPTNGPTGTKPGWSHTSRSRHVRRDTFAMATAVLNIQQLWASGSRTCEPILMKSGTQQQVRTTMTVTWSEILKKYMYIAITLEKTKILFF